MAEASLSITKERDFLTCQICMELFSTPKILPCLHSFCSGCVEHSIITTGCEGESHFSIKCPICRATADITSANAECLKTNLYTNSLVEVFRAKYTKTAFCSICHMKGNRTIAQCKCIECGDFLCKSCGNIHTFSKQTIHHTVIMMDELVSGKYDVQLRDAQNVFCEEHKDEIVKSYCNTCLQLVCMDCIISDHKSHDCVKGEHAMREIKPHLYRIITLQDQNIFESQERQTQFENELQIIRTEKWTAINTIHNFLAALITRISEEGDAVIDALVQLFDLAEKHIHEQRDRIKTNLQVFMETQRFCTSVLEHGKTIEVLSLYSELNNRLQTLQAIDMEAKYANTIVKYPVIKQDKLVSYDKLNLIYTETSNSSSPAGKKDPFVIWTKSVVTVVDDGNDRKEQSDNKYTATPGEYISEALEREPITRTVPVYHNEEAHIRDVSVESLPPREKANTEQVDQGEKANEPGNNTLIQNSEKLFTQKKQTYQTEQINHEEKATTRKTSDVSIPLKAVYNAEQNDELEKATNRENSDKVFTQKQNKDETEQKHTNEQATTRESSDVPISRGENGDTEQTDEIRKTIKQEHNDKVFTEKHQTDRIERLNHKDKSTTRVSSAVSIPLKENYSTNQNDHLGKDITRENSEKGCMQKQKTDQKENIDHNKNRITRETCEVSILRKEQDNTESNYEIGKAAKRENSNKGFTKKQQTDQKVHHIAKAITRKPLEVSIPGRENDKTEQKYEIGLATKSKKDTDEQFSQKQHKDKKEKIHLKHKTTTKETSEVSIPEKQIDKTEKNDEMGKATKIDNQQKDENEKIHHTEKATTKENSEVLISRKEKDNTEQNDEIGKGTKIYNSDKGLTQKQQTYQTENTNNEEKATRRQTSDVSMPLKAKYNAEQSDELEKATKRENSDKVFTQKQNKDEIIHNNDKATTREYSDVSISRWENDDTEQTDKIRKTIKEENNDKLFTEKHQTDQIEPINNKDKATTSESSEISIQRKEKDSTKETLDHNEIAITRETCEVSILRKEKDNTESNYEIGKAAKRENSDKGFTMKQQTDQKVHHIEKAITGKTLEVSLPRMENEKTGQKYEIGLATKRKNSDIGFTQKEHKDKNEKIHHKEKTTTKETSEVTIPEKERANTDTNDEMGIATKIANSDTGLTQTQQKDQNENIHHTEKATTKETSKVSISPNENDKMEQNDEIGKGTKIDNIAKGLTQNQQKRKKKKQQHKEKAITRETSGVSIPRKDKDITEQNDQMGKTATRENSVNEFPQKPQIHQTEQVGQKQKYITMGTSDKLSALNENDKTNRIDPHEKAGATTDNSIPQKPHNGPSDQLDRKENANIAIYRRKSLTSKDCDQAKQVDERVNAATKATSDKSIWQKETVEHETVAIRETNDNVSRRNKQQGGYFIRNIVKSNIVCKQPVWSNTEESTGNTASSDIDIGYHKSFFIKLHEENNPIITTMVVTNTNTVMMADETNRCVKEFSTDGTPLRSFRNIQTTPLRMDIRDERLAVSDNKSMRIIKTSDEQTISVSLFDSDRDTFPIVFDKTQTDIIAVGNLIGNYRIPITFVNMKGKIVSHIHTTVDVLPIFMGQNSEGDLIISDWAVNCIRIVTPEGRIKAEYSPEFTKKEKETNMTKKDDSCFWRPGDIAVGADDTIYVCDMLRSRIMLLDKRANWITEVDLHTFCVIKPRSVCIAADGILVVANETTNVTVLKVKPTSRR